MGRDFAQLHLGHDRRSQGRRLPPSRRQSARGRQRRHRRHGPPSGLSLDAADVPLQRLVLPLVDQRQGGRACLPAAGARQADLRPHRRAQGHPLVRRADRHVGPAQRARRRRSGRCPMSSASSPPPRPPPAAVLQGDARGGLRSHPSLRPDRDLWPRGRQRLEGGVERARRRSPGASEGAPGRALSRARGARRHRPRDDAAPSRPTARRWAR